MRFKRVKKWLISANDFINRLTDFIVYLPLVDFCDMWKRELEEEKAHAS